MAPPPLPLPKAPLWSPNRLRPIPSMTVEKKNQMYFKLWDILLNEEIQFYSLTEVYILLIVHTTGIESTKMSRRNLTGKRQTCFVAVDPSKLNLTRKNSDFLKKLWKHFGKTFSCEKKFTHGQQAQWYNSYWPKKVHGCPKRKTNPTTFRTKNSYLTNNW